MAERLEYLVETDFLFGLRPSDGLNGCVTSTLERQLEGGLRLVISGASPVEANAVMASQGLAEKQIGEAASLMGISLQKYGLERYTEITIGDVQRASCLRWEHRKLTYFDSLHAAIAERRGVTILSSDPIYRDLGVKWMDLREMT